MKETMYGQELKAFGQTTRDEIEAAVAKAGSSPPQVKCDRCKKQRPRRDTLGCTCCDGRFCIIGDVGDTLQVENNEQRDKRLAR